MDFRGAGEMIQQLRVLVAFVRLGLVLSTHIVAYKYS